MTNPGEPGNSMVLPDQAAFLPPPQTRRVSRRGRPSLALLAALLINPIILIGYYLYLYGPGTTCVAGSLVCNFGNYPAIVQVALMAGGCVVLGLVLLLLMLGLALFHLARRLVEAPSGERNPLIRGLSALTDASRIQPLLLTYGLALLVGLCIGLLKREISPPIVVLSVLTIFACLQSALARGPKERGTAR